MDKNREDDLFPKLMMRVSNRPFTHTEEATISSCMGAAFDYIDSDLPTRCKALLSVLNPELTI